MNEWQDNNRNTDQNSGQYYNPGPACYNQPCNDNNQPAGGYPQYYNPYANPQIPCGQAQPVKQPVSNIFYYILMALTAVSAILTLSATISMIRAAVDGSLFSSLTTGQEYASLYAVLMDAFTNSPTFSMYPMLNYILRTAILVVSILDIVQVRRNRYPILGLILLTIFFKPGYFLWRAHAVKQKMLLPAMFTAFYILLYVGYFFWCVSYLISLA